ncbi:uncharacterized protein EKO05_0008897 [Ascochyta rabiei]|uniref:Uncharacterized protein n=1 Tax=Didymella rabiei TaxID=5454 RepID=A0A163AQE9_DIDRA|nr:uncharacterized protein EKO05_0008897 [Ascochyta rabiei]KZM21325.1 hypothetical protein ST47_g7528 [Ascochyta rabiei]UPX18603.1 hypothetical protein EKO05_0008897 [Ascochyta rabiei]
MVSFRKLFVSAAALAVPVSAFLTPAQIVSTINVITTKSQALQVPAQSITLLNAPLIVVGLGPLPQIIFGFTDIVVTATGAIAQLPGTPTVLPGAPSDAIFDAFREFVRVHQVLLNILIGKAGLFNAVPFIGAPVSAALRQIEKVVDAIAFGLINLVQSRASDLQAQATSLKVTIDVAVDSYDGISLAKREMSRPLRYARREGSTPVAVAA